MFDDGDILELLDRLFPGSGASGPGGPRGPRRLMDRFVRWLLPVIRARVNKVLRARGRFSKAQSDDLCQDVWEVLFKDAAAAMKKFDPNRGMSFRGFIGLKAEGIAINQLAKARAQRRGGRKDGRGPLPPKGPDVLDWHPAGQRRGAEDGWMARMLIPAIRVCIRGSLSEREGKIYFLFTDEPVDHKTIAERLRISMNAVYKAISKGNKAREACERAYLDPPDDSA